MKTGIRVLVTGAAGFIGKAIINVLANCGHDVIALYKEKEIPTSLRDKCQDVIRGDICEKDISNILFHDIDVVCHSAAFIPKNYDSINDAEKCYQTNALATLNLAASAIVNNVSRFIYISAGNMYTFSQKLATEEDPVFPSGAASPYFVSKLAGEIYTSYICQSSNMTGIILRIGTPYGPGEPQHKLIPSLFKQASFGKELTIYHGGLPRYNFVYIGDIATCVENAITKGESGIYNVASGESTTIKDVVQTIASVTKLPLKIKFETPTLNTPRGFAPFSIEKAMRTWNFQPLDLNAGLRNYWETIKVENNNR